jgi:2-amino-4-hydroxy-6-hydroxymethyldihydropteridine diphosphokinase
MPGTQSFERQRVFVGIGSNVEPERHVCAALARLEQRFGPIERSRIYRNAPVGFAGNSFLNLVAGFVTAEPAGAVVRALDAIERDCGRCDSAGSGPRTLDLDLLLYGARIIAGERLRVPRAEILTQAYVLGPLAELAGEVMHPQTGKRLAELWQAFDKHTHALHEVDIDCARVAKRQKNDI